MKKHPKTSFGILEDGQIIKLAALQRDGYQTYVMNLDQVELDKPLYVSPEQLEQYNREHTGGELNLDDFAQEFVTGLKRTPWDQMFASVRLDSGVIAVNANEENIVRGSGIPETKVGEKVFARGNLTPLQMKSGEYQGSRFEIGGASQYWLHKGPNQLVELLRTYGKRNKLGLYFQLADANDIVLADYYRIHNLGDNQRHLLVYLGKEYRKAFLFDKGALVDIYPLNITQDLPEAELIFSRVSFALDNAQQAEPDKIVICGDLASRETVSYFNHHDSGRTSLLAFENLIVHNGKADLYDEEFMAQFALPIALAHKALYPDEARYTPSNFLTPKQLEAQKPFRIAWHGYLILAALFALAFFGTILYMGLYNNYKKEQDSQRRMQHELSVLQVQAAEITRMRAEMEQFGKNLEIVRGIIEGKNPWSAVLDTLNRIFEARPLSWLTNFKMANGRLHLSGITTQRGHVIDIAATLPESRIQKVTSSTIRGKTVWNFEITSGLPEVDWVGQIEAETAELLARTKAEKEKAQAELAAQEQAAAAKAAAELKAAEEAAAKLDAQERAAAEKKAQADKLAAEKKAAAAKLAAEKKAAADKLAEDKAAAQKAAADKLAAEKKAAADKLAAQKKAAADKLAAEKKAAADKLIADKAAADKKAAAPKAASIPAAPPVQKPVAGTQSHTLLPKLTAEYMPQASDWQSKAPANELAAYNAFAATANRPDLAEIKRLGDSFLKQYKNSRLAPLLRWHLANKLYSYGEYIPAMAALDPLVHYVDPHYPYALLLAARLDHAQGRARYKDLYILMDRDYAGHAIGGRVKADLDILGLGGAK